MNTSISQNAMIRGADGRLYALTTAGVVEVAEAGASAARTMIRAGDRLAFDTADHEAARVLVTPGL